MNKKLIPTYHANSIFEIDVEFYKKIGAKVLLLDLDNTLDSYLAKEPTQKTIDLINKLKNNNIRPIITSNNTGERVNFYAKQLNIECFSFVRKPFRWKLLRILKRNNINKEDCLIIGDQIYTDVKCGNAAKIDTLLTEKLVEEDPIFTRFNRIFENKVKNKLYKQNKLRYWKEVL